MAAPRSAAPNHLRLEEADHRLGQCVVIGVAATADGRLDAGLSKPLRVANREIARAAIAMVYEPLLSCVFPLADRLLQGVQGEVTLQRTGHAPADDPGRFPSSRWRWRIQPRNVSAEQPIFCATDWIAAHSDSYSCACSPPSRAGRSRTSAEYCFALAMAPISQGLEPPANPGRFSHAPGEGRKRLPFRRAPYTGSRYLGTVAVTQPFAGDGQVVMTLEIVDSSAPL